MLSQRSVTVLLYVGIDFSFTSGNRTYNSRVYSRMFQPLRHINPVSLILVKRRYLRATASIFIHFRYTFFSY